jgi:hypothetical protein
MKKSKFYLYGLLILALPLSVMITGCDNDDDDDMPKVNYTLSATANGQQEVPANTTTGSGSLTGTYNSSTNALAYTLNWTNLTGAPTLMHFHGPALAGANASPALTISGFPTTASGTYNGTATLTETQEADLLAGKWYWNVHTSANGGGEIRGQVGAQ